MVSIYVTVSTSQSVPFGEGLLLHSNPLLLK